MECKNGAEHLQSLRDGRTVYLDGKLVDDVTTSPAYRNAVATAGLLYDYQSRPENTELMTLQPEGGARRVNRCWQMPRSYEELVQRRKALQAWAHLSHGFLGRSPDHVASAVIGQRMGLDVFAKHGPARAQALTFGSPSSRRRLTRCRWPTADSRAMLFSRPVWEAGLLWGGKQCNIWSKALEVRCRRHPSKRSRYSKESSSRISST
jgi:hypothetical protein